MALKGQSLSQATKDKIRANHAHFWKGKTKPLTPETIQKIRLSNIGRKISQETKNKLSQSHLGQVAWNKGIKSPLSGNLHWNWQGGVTLENHRIRSSLENKLWRIAVFKRDDYTCVMCHLRGGRLEADHIKPFSIFPELRFAINNGRTLCKPCHRQHGWSLFKENNPRKQ